MKHTIVAAQLLYCSPLDTTNISLFLPYTFIEGIPKGYRTNTILIMHNIQRRNQAIRQRFFEELGKGLPIMEAYAKVGHEFYLGERRVREIIAEKK